jgi:hypothetical protein
VLLYSLLLLIQHLLLLLLILLLLLLVSPPIAPIQKHRSGKLSDDTWWLKQSC